MKDETKREAPVSRRTFVRASAAAAVGLAGCTQDTTTIAALPGKGGAKGKMKVGLIGSGGRGTGAAGNAAEADGGLNIVAIADLYQDRIDDARKRLKKQGVEVDPKNTHLGFDAYKKVLDSDADYVILGTPPHYRPEQFEACIEAGKHVFMEKPVAVDPVGVRRIIAAGEKAKKKGLCVVAGTQRRHQKKYLETMKRIHDGAIGEIVAAQCYWNTGQLWYKKRQKGWSELDWMIRDWVNWAWLSGDHIIEQHVHQLDVMNWAIGTHPIKVVSMGARHRRVTGNQFDFFSSDFEYPNHVHVHSMCRQINGCANNVSEHVVGQKGFSNCAGKISNLKDFSAKDDRSPYIQEHADLMASIRGGAYINEARNVAESTLTGIMGRISAYTGKPVTWKEMMKSKLVLSKPTYSLTPENIRADIPVPGKA